MDIKRVYTITTTSTKGNVVQLLTTGKINNLPLSGGKVLGIAQDNAGTILLKGLSTIHTGLTIGSKYYYDSNGVLSTTVSGTYIGYAISATDLFIADYIIS